MSGATPGAATKWPVLALAALLTCGAFLGFRVVGKRTFPSDTSPEGAYVRIALAIAERHPRDAFAYLETEAQWASFTVHEMRQKACNLVRATFPADERAKLVGAWQDEADAPDGPDVFAVLARKRGWVGRLERDLSGVSSVEIQGDRATVITARGTRYPFRRRDNGIWGITIFTAELQAEAERASRDAEVVEKAAHDYASHIHEP
jgi:hypothetical protein